MSLADPNDGRESVWDLMASALDLPLAERRAFFEKHLPAGGTRDEALELLAEVVDLDGFLERPLVADPTRYQPAVPARIASYEVVRALGWGSMGVVYLARQESTARHVAVKVLRLDANNAAAADRFQREALVLGQLTHPGIATVYEAGTSELDSGSQPWFAMEYVDGMPLTTFAEEEQLDRRARVRLIAEVARAVQHAHGVGVVHRDLKPENVLVRPDGSPCILDFGVARILSENEDFLTLTATGQVVGTLAYMAPEQARGGVVDERADQFAVGAMLFELLTGELPLPVRGQLPHDALRIVAEGTCQSPSRFGVELDHDLQAIVYTALAPEVSRRYASLGALAEDLDRWLAGEPVSARPPTRWSIGLRFARRNPLLVGGVVSILFLLGAASTFVLQAAMDRERESEVALLFSDRRLLTELQTQASSLWPTRSSRVHEFEDWIKSANGLLERLPQHRAALARLDEAGRRTNTRVGDALGDAWLVDEGRVLIASLEEFAAPGGLLAEMAERRNLSRDLATLTVSDHSSAWDAAIQRVREDARFDRFALVPQEGLIPLGPDPSTDLEEFAVYATGTTPTRDRKGGSIVPRSIIPRIGDAIVLVLIPGGDVRIGSQPKPLDEAEPPDRRIAVKDHEGPPVAMSLVPFLIGKFEMTQDQWVRLFNFNPSDWEVGTEIEGVTVGPLHPVESLSWKQAMEALPRYGLGLPTEAQWEVAAKAGDELPRLGGDSIVRLVSYVNWGWRASLNSIFGPSVIPDDGYMTHRPVGDLLPNSYGLHDVLGNVWELCLDNYKVKYHQLEHRPGDGLVLAEPDGDVSRRGASSGDHAQSVHVFVRQVKRFDGRDALTGIRPARSLETDS